MQERTRLFLTEDDLAYLTNWYSERQKPDTQQMLASIHQEALQIGEEMFDQRLRRLDSIDTFVWSDIPVVVDQPIAKDF